MHLYELLYALVRAFVCTCTSARTGTGLHVPFSSAPHRPLMTNGAALDRRYGHVTRKHTFFILVFPCQIEAKAPTSHQTRRPASGPPPGR
ncbi:hypothetical protein J3F84DRAFT_376378 [Trichoderma pleuroticola]